MSGRLISRRAALKAIGLSPLVVGSALASAEGAFDKNFDAEHERWHKIDEDDAAWIMDDEDDLDDLVRTKAKAWAAINGYPFRWHTEQPKYKKLVRSLWAFFKYGIEDFGGSAIAPAEHLLRDAFRTEDAQGKVLTNTGEVLIRNLCNFDLNDGPLDVETSACAYQCGLRAAEIQVDTFPGSLAVAVGAYNSAWREVSLKAKERTARTCKTSGVGSDSSRGGGC